ncbi:MAG: acyl-CoA synthetase [Pseudomonadota bacterium]
MNDDGNFRISNRVMNLGDFLVQAADRYPYKPAIIRNGMSLTWSELNARVDTAAWSLKQLGVDKGDKIVVQSRNCFEMFETMFVTFKLGAIWIPTNFRIAPSDVSHVVSASGARFVIYDDAFPEHADAAIEAGAKHVICIGKPRDGELSYSELSKNAGGEKFETAEVDYNHPCWFFFTSGTTGKPKAAVLSHGQMAFVITNHLADLMPGTDANDASLVVAPLSHGAGVHQLIQVARCVPTILMKTEKFDAEEALSLIEQHQISNMFTVPTILNALATDPAIERFDLTSLRHVIYAGAPMLREHQKRALDKFGNCLVQYFGLGEVTGNITVLPKSNHSLSDNEMRLGSCGYARTGMKIEIQDDQGQALAPHKTGEICVIGPAVFSGYYKNDEANAAAFRNGWFRTGDLGHLDENGYLYITGRASDMFISGGSNIYPLEIEECIAGHPDVIEACVVGMPDEKWGEIGVAAVSLRDGAEMEYDQLKSFLKKNLASYKIPKRLVVFDVLPKSGYGKITKNIVRAAIEDRMV